MTPPLRLLLVDDNLNFLVSAVAFLRTQPQVSLVGGVRSGEHALTLLDSCPVDLVLLDLNMCGLDGLETTRQIKAGPRAPKVVIVTLEDAPENRLLALVAGADGFIGKAEFTTALFPLIATLYPDTAP